MIWDPETGVTIIYINYMNAANVGLTRELILKQVYLPVSALNHNKDTKSIDILKQSLQNDRVTHVT